MLIEFREKKTRRKQTNVVFHALGQQEGPAIEQYAFVYAYATGMSKKSGNQDGTSHMLSVSLAVVDVYLWTPSKKHPRK